MKTPILLALLVTGILAGCAADKSGDTQVVTPNGGVPKDQKSMTSNANVPKGAAPGATK